METSPSLVKSLIYTPGDKPQLQVLDQLLIPAEKVYVDVPNVESAWAVIREMKVRGRKTGVLLVRSESSSFFSIFSLFLQVHL